MMSTPVYDVRLAIDSVALAELDSDHALSVAAHGPDLGLAEADRLAELGGDDHIVPSARRCDPVELVALLEVDRDQPVAPDVGVLGHRGLLDVPVLRDH